tara:strand:- start:96 stop:752 length:657 start_codon:yes stop_codon:yes gene_type:complete
MCGYAGAVAGAADAYTMGKEAELQADFAKDEFEIAQKKINLERDQAGRATARNQAKLQIRKEQERQVASKKKQIILKKQLQEEATATVMAEAKNIDAESASVEAFQNQLTRENLNAIQTIEDDYKSITEHIAMMSADNWENLNQTRKALDLSLEAARKRKEAKTPDMGLVSLGQFSALLKGYITDKQLGEQGDDTWGLQALFSGKETTAYKGISIKKS